MAIIPKMHEINNTLHKSFSNFAQRFHLSRILWSVGAAKEKGVSAFAVFMFVFSLVFTGKNLYQVTALSKDKPAFGKDVTYRFLDQPSVHWEAIVQRLSVDVIAEIDTLTSKERKTALIIDDTSYWRNRSTKVELLSWCWDHSQNRHYKGFTMLNLGWSDGQTFVPIDFKMLASGDDKKVICPSDMPVDHRTRATKRRIDAQTDKPTHVLKMLHAVKGTPAQTKHVLFDSWFASPSAILDIKALGYDVVCRVKNHENHRYLYNGEALSISKIYKANKKRPGRAKYLLSVDVQVRHKEYDKTIPAKLVYVRNRNTKQWLALLSTDTTLTEEEIIALYGKRWDIEPFHKVLKSNLRLAGEFQIRSFDAIVAHTAVVLARYIYLALENRNCKDERTLGALFFFISEELEDISFAFAMRLVLETLQQHLNDFLHLAKSQILTFVEQFIKGLPGYIKEKMELGVCES